MSQIAQVPKRGFTRQHILLPTLPYTLRLVTLCRPPHGRKAVVDVLQQARQDVCKALGVHRLIRCSWTNPLGGRGRAGTCGHGGTFAPTRPRSSCASS